MVGRALGTLAFVGLLGVVVLVGASGFVADLPVAGLAGESVDGDNPYRESELVVGIEANGSRAFAPLVEEAVAYWEQHGERYADYPVNFSIAPDAADPDIEVAFTPAVEECGGAERAAGCSPKITRPLQTIGVVDVWVLDDLSNDSTVHVLRHELGHALGLGHDDPPRSLMAGRSPLTRLAETDATDREFPWRDPDLTVAVDRSGVPDGKWAATDEQLADALGYYARGADGRIPENVSLRRVANASTADVVIRFAEGSSRCDREPGSCGRIAGTDPDGDGDLETHTGLTITLANVDTPAVGWHVARWLGRGFGLDGDAFPPALRANASDATRRGAWWK